MKDIFEVEYQIVDRGATHPVVTAEVIVKKGGDVLETLKSDLRKCRHAYDLTTKFQVSINNTYHIGWKC